MFGGQWGDLDDFSKCVLVSVGLGLVTVAVMGPYGALFVFAASLFICASNPRRVLRGGGGKRSASSSERDSSASQSSAPKAASNGAAPSATDESEAPAAKPSPDPDAPVMLSAPEGGEADDLKMLRGVGPKLEGVLNEMGFFHFDQIAQWSPENVAWVDRTLEGVNRGRASRDDWVAQAKTLASGEMTDFAKRVDAGDVPSSQ